MAQAFSDLKVALEKGKGSVEALFPVFEKSCQEFAHETRKVPPEPLKQFLDQVQLMSKEIQQGDPAAILEQMDGIKKLKKSCHEKYK